MAVNTMQNMAPSRQAVQIKILGTGCPNCKRLERHTREAIERLGISADVAKVEDIGDITEYGIMRTPALVADDRVLLYGRVPSVEEIARLLADLA